MRLAFMEDKSNTEMTLGTETDHLEVQGVGVR